MSNRVGKFDTNMTMKTANNTYLGKYKTAHANNLTNVVCKTKYLLFRCNTFFFSKTWWFMGCVKVLNL